MYAAKHYIRVGGKRYVAGEILPDNVPEETLSWLLRKDAIGEVPEGPAPVAAFADDGGENPVTDAPPADAAPAEDETGEEEIDEEAEPPEIDAAEGIVAEEKPKAKAGRGKGGKRK